LGKVRKEIANEQRESNSEEERSHMGAETPPQALSEWRKMRQLTQSELAQMAHASQSTISDIEAGTLLPNVALALRIARAVGVSVEDIIWRDDRAHHRKKEQSNT
jgi:DNA-binding XRE family transcriptional regulator